MFARTPRTLLRPGWREDAEALHLALCDEAVVRNLASVPWPYRLADAQAFLSAARPILFPNFLIYHRSAGAARLIGSIGLAPAPCGGAELGFWISRADWNRGFATEAGVAALSAIRALGHQHIIAEHFIDNPASARVLKKLGFKPAHKTTPRFSKGRGQMVEAVQFRANLTDALTPDEKLAA